ncbi:MAG: hypothetical protein H6722_10150 [Sandaracinus sp.]|nr:hypothetical protein [Sandaracinus sp.]MCB9618218.1 hypothetical protein [Sandaracinus sp.]MCB9625396.1 hypothetical protein [Sandaracinus sp.]
MTTQTLRSLLLVLLASGCGAANPGWSDEVRRQSALELECSDHQIAIQRYQGHNYEALGCDHAVRYVCRDRVCTTASEPVASTHDGFRPFVERVEAVRARLRELGPRITAACSEGQPFSAKLVLRPQGAVSDLETMTRREGCLMQELRAESFASGTGVLQLTHVFRAD